MAERVTGPNTRDDPPVTTDYGMVVRPIGPGSGGAVIVEEIPSANSTVTAIPAAVVVTPLLAANPNRLGFTIYNSSTVDTLYVLCSAVGVVSPALFTVAICPEGFYEDEQHYIGAVTGIWTGATGAAMVTEYLP